MKAKFPILIAAGLFFATVSKAQYPGGYADHRDQSPYPQGQDYNYNNQNGQGQNYYNANYDYRYHGRYDDRRDWKEVEYQRYCREHRDCRMDRRVFYRDYCGAYRAMPFCPPHRVVVFRF